MTDLQKQLAKIKKLELENPNEALEEYGRLLENAGEDRGRVMYGFGCFLHNFAEEEMALDLLSQAFEEGTCREEILELLLRDFWEPNREEFREAYLLQTEELLRIRKNLTVPDFDALPYRMFPVSDTRFMVYNRKQERFLGWLCVDGELEKKRFKEPGAFFPVIMDMKNGSLQDIAAYLYQNRDRRLYVIEEEAEWTGLLIIPGIRDKMSSVTPLKGMEEVKRLFSKETLRIPEIVRIKEGALASEVGEFFREVHRRRIQEEGKEERAPLLTIGIPSWNRGKRARELVELLCRLPLDVDLEILVSNNGSDKGAEDYHRIRDMRDSRVTYIEFEENKMYYGNIAQVLRKASGRWVMILSDEDFIDGEALLSYMEKLEQLKERVAVIRPGSTKQYRDMKEEYEKAGEDALAVYSLNNNYVSGATYNRKFLTKELVDKIEKSWIGHYAYQIYAHMIFDWYMCLKGDFYRYPPAVIIEGEAEDAADNRNLCYEYNKFDNRIRQFRSYIDVINGMEELTERERIILFITACTKTIFLLCMLRNIYREEKGSWEACREEYFKEVKEMYERLNVRQENRVFYEKNIEGYIRKAAEFLQF